jgi:hypothetical protein
MQASVFIEQHERFEALETYKDKLSAEQIDEIEDAPEGALIRLVFGSHVPTQVLVIEEG